MAKSCSLPEPEDVFAVQARRDGDIRRSGGPPPGRIHLGHHQAVIVEHDAQVGVAAGLPGRAAA